MTKQGKYVVALVAGGIAVLLLVGGALGYVSYMTKQSPTIAQPEEPAKTGADKDMQE